MAGFLSKSTSMSCLKVKDECAFTLDALRAGAFAPVSDDLAYGFVGMGDRLDTENFELALFDASFAGFSFRLDERKPSQAAVKLEIDKAVKAEKEKGFLSRSRKREISESIKSRMKAEAPFVPILVDCIWDIERKRVYMSSASESMVDLVQNQIMLAFGVATSMLEPAANIDMANIFQAFHQSGKYVGTSFLMVSGSASLASCDESPGRVSVRDDVDIIRHALDESMEIKRQSFDAYKDGSSPDPFTSFILDQGLRVYNLSLPESENDSGAFILNAAICQATADILWNLASGNIMEVPVNGK